MQDYTYSVFSIVAIAIHLIINFDMLAAREGATAHATRYRGFLLGILAYYVSDAAWGIFAELRWKSFWYIDTIFFFLSLVAFVFMWGRFVIVYLALDKWMTRIISYFGYALWIFNFAALALNPFNKCVFYFDEQGAYACGPMRDPAFYLLIAFNVLMAISVFVKFWRSRDDSVRRRSMMVFMCCITLAVAIALQVIWPLTPFTALGCLISNCFLHVFVVQDEQTARHMAELEQALERAHAAEKARSMFFSIVSHDIRTPLNAILGYSELLQHGVKTGAERDEALRAIRASGTTLLQLVNDVLDLAKMDSGKMTFHKDHVLLSHLTDEVFASFKFAADGKGIELVNRAAGVPPLLLDEHRFRHILFNLVGNAVKYTARGSVTVAAFYAGGSLEIAVSDTGCGIAPDMLASIFDPFVQVQDPRHAADRAGGTGLGLSICKHLVQAMGGDLAVESEPGKGSVFRARIPGVPTADNNAAEAAVAPKPVVVPNKLPDHVLIVDDSPVNRAVMTAFLKKAGVAAIDNVGDGADALEKIASAMKEAHPYDFVLSDLWMPNMNGFEFIEKLRADSGFSKLPVFAVTADTEYGRDARIELFNGILLKPLTYDKLMATFAERDPA